MAARRPVVFLDDGGVMNDNSLRSPQWAKLLSEFMPGRLGGTPDCWAEANRVQFPKVWNEIVPRMAEFRCHADFQREYDLMWLDSMCDHLGISAPEESQALKLAHEATAYIAARVRAEYPDTVESIRGLHRAGFELHTASGTRSWELDTYLRNMGVRECFGSLFGPDLVDMVKAGPEYYRRVFEAAKVDPVDALVVEDGTLACGWASAIGASFIRIDRDGGTPASGTAADLRTVAAWLIDAYP